MLNMAQHRADRHIQQPRYIFVRIRLTDQLQNFCLTLCQRAFINNFSTEFHNATWENSLLFATHKSPTLYLPQKQAAEAARVHTRR
jgi:hypothetical protein